MRERSRRGITRSFGTQDPRADWAGWVYATDADSGEWKWRLKSNYRAERPHPEGWRHYFVDMKQLLRGGTNNGERALGQKLDGAVGGGVITTPRMVHRRCGATGVINLLATEVAEREDRHLGLGHRTE